VTGLLLAWEAGETDALERLTPLVYDVLRRLARRHLARERPGHVLQPTALVHEVYLKLVDQRRVHWRSRAHFYARAAREMRRILIDAARRQRAAKRGGGAITLRLEEIGELPPAAGGAIDLEVLDEALRALETTAPRQGRVVELRFFGGLTVEETAAVVGVSPATIKTDWRLARARLFQMLEGG